jgi:hypothetical protein
LLNYRSFNEASNERPCMVERMVERMVQRMVQRMVERMVELR